jgi:hypothetical protein
MQIHSIEECESWVYRRSWHNIGEKVLMFEPEIDKWKVLTWNIVDINGKSFQHSVDRIENDIVQICENYPNIKPIVDNLHIFMCPKPSVDTSNACASTQYICYFARSTQIPTYMTDYITGHELGHVVEYNLCSKRKKNRFREYLELRKSPIGICQIYDDDKEIYVDKEDFYYYNGNEEEKKKYHGEWDTSPQEWFAEDFRYLFGADQREMYWGLPIAPPDETIKQFFLSL